MHQAARNLGTQNLRPEPLLLQQLQRSQRRSRVGQIPDILGSRPVAQVGEVGDKGGGLEELLGGEVVEVEGGGEHGDEFQFELEAGETAVEMVGGDRRCFTGGRGLTVRGIGHECFCHSSCLSSHPPLSSAAMKALSVDSVDGVGRDCEIGGEMGARKTLL